MVTDDLDNINNKDAHAEEDPPIKCEVKEEVEDVESDVDLGNDYMLDGSLEDEDVLEDNIKEEDSGDEWEPSRPTKELIKRNVSCANKRKGDEGKRGENMDTFPHQQKASKEDEGFEEPQNDSVPLHYAVRNKRGRFSKNRRSLPPRCRPVQVELIKKEDKEQKEEENEGVDGTSVRVKPKKKKEECPESLGYSAERKNVCNDTTPPKRKILPPRIPEVFSTLEEFTDCMEKRVNASIDTAIGKDDEDPRVHQHFYLAVHECVEAGLKQGLISADEVDNIWKNWDDFAAKQFETREIRTPEDKIKKRRVGRHYMKVQKVNLSDNQYQDMLKKTRRLKTMFVRNNVLKSVEENNGANKIINDLKVRREFFNMLLEVPGATSKVAVLSSIKTLWKQLVYGKKDDWSKYLANKERVLEKRKELMDPENVKMRRYLYRQAYLSSLPREEKERRNRVKQEYLKKLRSTMSEEKRQKLREKNKNWRMSLTGERRERYIERVYTAIRKRNERLKYERAGLKPPDELLPIRTGRNKTGRGRGQSLSSFEIDREGQNPAIEVLSSETLGARGVGRGRKSSSVIEALQSTAITPVNPATALPEPAPTATIPLSSENALTLCAGSFPTQIQQPQKGISTYPNFGALPTSVDYFGQIMQQNQPQLYHHNGQCPQPPVTTSIGQNNHSILASHPLSTPPYNYSIRGNDQHSLPQISSSLHPHNESYNHGDNYSDSNPEDEDLPSPARYYEDASLSNSRPSPRPMADDTSHGISKIHQVEAKPKKVPNKISISSVTSKNSTTPSSTPEICEECGMQFSRSYDLRKHINFAHNEDETNRRCPVCGKEFNLPRSLWRHIIRHHRGNTDASQEECKPKRPTRVSHDPCSCELCGKEFLTGDIRKAYRDHMRRTHKRKEQPFTSGVPIKLKEPNPKIVQCEFCDKEMLYISLRRHIRNAHRTNDAISFPCEECGKAFKEKRYLTDHVRLTHSFNFHKMIESRNLLSVSYSKEDPGTEIFTCTICSENISERLQFRTHLLKKHVDVFQEISSSNAAFSRRECEVCKATFPKEIELREHLTTQHPDISWNCPHCAKFYCTQSSLLKHIKNIHRRKKSKGDASNEENLKKCPKCKDMIEGGEAEMWVHIKALHKETIVYCNYCGKPKWSKKLLSDHHRICRLRPPKNKDDAEDNDNESKLICNLCGTKLKHQASLDRHMRDIHKVHKMEFRCEEPECYEVFAQKMKLNDHLEKVHGLRIKRKEKRKRRDSSSEEELVPQKNQRKSERIKKMEETPEELEEVKVELLSDEDDDAQFYFKSEPE